MKATKRPPRRYDLGEHHPEWEGFIFDDGQLHHPYWRRPFTAGDLRAMFYTSQQVRILEHELTQARRDLETAQAAQDAAEHRAQFYRQQLQLESRMGMMLTAFSTT